MSAFAVIETMLAALRAAERELDEYSTARPEVRAAIKAADAFIDAEADAAAEAAIAAADAGAAELADEEGRA